MIFRYHPTRSQWTSLLVIMPFVGYLVLNLLYGPQLFTDFRVWLFAFPAVLIVGVVSWMAQIAAVEWLRHRLDAVGQTIMRIMVTGFVHLCIRATAFIAIFYFFDAVHFLGYQLNPEKLKFALLFAVAMMLIGTSMWEADFSMRQWKQSIAQKQQMEQLTLHQEFEALKGQVNPHFLFNCFNTLSSLIVEDRKGAEAFLNELSKVYRYLLRNNKDGLSTLQTEIKFIESYYRLLQTRHGAAVQMQIDVDKKYEQYLLPSLSLQLLVENAVKHNVLSKNKPLQIDIFTTSGKKLVVSNNMQLRIQKAVSNGVGLQNISAKYSLLGVEGYQVLDEGANFSVVLPLIWSNLAEEKFSRSTVL